MKTEFFECETKGFKFSAVVWLPDGKPKAVLQITHGMTEHIGRYERFAHRMTENGIAVCGFDLRGHGKNGTDKEIASFGKEGWVLSLEDMRNLYLEMKKRMGNTPYFMFGFSLGSFLLREYLSLYPDGLDGAVIVGTGYQSAFVLSLMKGFVHGECKKAGFDGTTALVKELSFETYNKKFEPNRTDSDWLCADEKELDDYIQDPLCRNGISAGLFWQLLDSMKRTGEKNAACAWKKDMPILLLSGENDSVGSNGKGVQTVYRQWKTLGLSDVTMKLFSGARHDLFHERVSGTADEAETFLLRWMEERLA